jgi:hypothetical protein
VCTGTATSTVVVQEGIPKVGEVWLTRDGVAATAQLRTVLGDRLELSCATPEAKLYYTVDGTEPTLCDGLLYVPGESRIVVESWAPFIRVVAYKQGHRDRTFISSRPVVLLVPRHCAECSAPHARALSFVRSFVHACACVCACVCVLLFSFFFRPKPPVRDGLSLTLFVHVASCHMFSGAVLNFRFGVPFLRC